MFDRRLKLSNQVAEEAIDYFGDTVYETKIPRNVRLGEAPSFGQPILLYDVDCVGARSYLELAQEVMTANRPALKDGDAQPSARAAQAGQIDD
jgi:chromosome partitioning protein